MLATDQYCAAALSINPGIRSMSDLRKQLADNGNSEDRSVVL